jgi:PAS domain S-box-containing protein
MAELIRSKDWSTTPLGAIDTWSETLLSTVNLLLLSPFSFGLYWGEEMILIYNDVYRPFLGEKHPDSLGARGPEVWQEAWPVIGTPILSALSEGKSSNASDAYIPVMINGVLQDRWWTYGFYPVYENGRIAGVANPGADDTPSVLARKAQKASEARLEQVLEATSDAIVSVNRDWEMTYLNPTARELYSSDRNVLGMRVWDAFPEAVYEGSPFVKHYYNAMDKGLAGAFETYYPEPLDFWIRLEVYPTTEGIVTFSRDITEEKRNHEALKASEESLRVAAEVTRLGLARVDIEAPRMLHCTPVFKANFGRGPDEDFTYAEFLECIHPEDRDRVRASVLEAAREDTMYRAEYRVIWPDGTLHWILARGRLIHFTDGRKPEMEGVTLDVTERHLSQLALLQNEKLAAVGRLAASIAHEINNPLESVTNLLYLARTSENFGDVKQYLETAERELRRVSAISNQTLRFHRQSTKPRSVTCDELFESVLSIYQGRLINSDVDISKRKRTHSPIECFDGEIRQVLNNLVGNALDAMPHSGRLVIRSREGTNWATGDFGVVLTVADTGSGMPKAVREKIFEAFYTTKGIGGTGLGLWLSQEIVARHNGTLRVRSSQVAGHSGTVFTLFLPFKAAKRTSESSTSLDRATA